MAIFLSQRPGDPELIADLLAFHSIQRQLSRHTRFLFLGILSGHPVVWRLRSGREQHKKMQISGIIGAQPLQLHSQLKRSVMIIQPKPWFCVE